MDAKHFLYFCWPEFYRCVKIERNDQKAAHIHYIQAVAVPLEPGRITTFIVSSSLTVELLNAP